MVDAEKLLSQSEPGRQGQAHLNEVQKAFQKGCDELLSAYRGQENTPEAQNVIAQGRAELERQMAVEHDAVTVALHAELAAAEAWRKKNPKYHAVLSRQLFLSVSGRIDFTSAVMEEMNKRRPKFAALSR